MRNIPITLRLGEGYTCASRWVEIGAGTRKFAFKPRNGKHRFDTDLAPIGKLAKFEGRRLLAGLSFGYDYDARNRSITVCSTDYVSQDTMCLSTVPEGTNEFCYQRGAGHGFYHDDLASNPHWNYLGQMTPGLEDYLREALRETTEGFIAALKNVPGLSVTVRGPAPVLPLDDYLNLVVVKRGGKFVGYYDRTKTYTRDCTYIGVESTYVGTHAFAANANFANVIGSDKDPKVPGFSSWITLWAAKCHGGDGPDGVCASTGFPAGFACNALIYGGHIIAGVNAAEMNPGDTVYILPICNAHNNDDNIHMQAINWRTAVQLSYW